MSTQPADLPQVLVDYLRMWNERDVEAVRPLLDRCVAEGCVWVDPVNAHTGRDALEANVREFRASFPDAELGLGSNVDSHHGRHRYEWYIVDGDQLVLRGFDVTVVDDAGLIERVDGFFGALERTGPT